MSEPEISTRRARVLGKNRGNARPSFLVEPGLGQQSVWDYPRPPVIVPDERRIRVVAHGVIILADTRGALRVLATASPPTFYLPLADIHTDLLLSIEKRSFCEWTGHARYLSVRLSIRLIDTAAWSYPEPFAEFEPIRGFIAFYLSAVECWVEDERVRPQPGRYYGCWVTSEIVGPFKVEPGTGGW